MKILSEYFNYLQYEKRYSKQTIISYKTDITQFLSFCNIDSEETDLAKITVHDVRAWLISLSEKNLSHKTLNRKITSLKRLFVYLNKKEIVSGNPTDTISSLKVSRKLPHYVEEFNMNELLDDEEGLFFENDFNGLRDKMILKTFYFTGIRLSELINISEKDIDFETATLKVFGKRKKERLIPLATSYMTDLRAYIQLKQEIYPQTPSFVFLTNKEQQLYPKFVYRLVNNYLQKVTTLTKTSPHIIRHTFATHLLNNGADLNAIKELLGHASLAATQVYTHNSIEKLKNTYTKSHPRN